MRADAAERRRRIITAAREIFSSGNDNASLEEIAKHAGVGIATLYRNFPDRTSLVSTIADEIFSQIADLQQSTKRSFPKDPQRAWVGYAKGLADLDLASLATTHTAEVVARTDAKTQELRSLAASQNDEIVRLAQAAGLVSPNINSQFFLSGLLTAVRPFPTTFFPFQEDFTEKMLHAFLIGIKNV